MATRNERKAKAKARHHELRMAVLDALEIEIAREKQIVDTAKQHFATIHDYYIKRANPVSRAGKVVKGKFQQAVGPKEPAKRNLVTNSIGLLIERKSGRKLSSKGLKPNAC